MAATALLAAVPLAAQPLSQEALDARHDRALAAGYKALMLCSGMAHSWREGFPRSAAHVETWEMAGIQEPLDGIVPELSYRVLRSAGPDSQVSVVEVDWAEGMPPRLASYTAGRGCALQPVAAARLAPDPDIAERSAAIVSLEDPQGSEVLQPVVQAAFGSTYGEGTRTTGVMIRRDDRLLEQHFADGFGPAVPQRTWSVAKSIAATLVGAAVQRGEAGTGDRAGLGSGPGDPRGSITIDHLLRMASGRYSDTPGNRTDPLYFGGAGVEEVALDWPLLHPPGSIYRYANNDTLAAVKAIEASFAAHPPAEVLRRLGMNDTVAETDWQGDYILSSQVWSSARDLAKLGQLYLDDGVLASGTRILPEGWADYVSAPAGPQPDGPMGYGAGFWLFNESEGVPPETFAAMGNRGQYVVIVPSREVVIVRRGEDPTGARFDIVAFTRDVLAALD